MRRHAKATTAGSTKRLGKSKPALPLCVLAASVAVLALVVGSASGATTRFLVETFGSSAQPSFPGDRGMAVDQATGELYVLETNSDEIRRYNSDGTPSNFAALGSNVIDGEGTGDETPDLGLAIAGSRSESQIAIDESGEATDGNIYVTESSRDQVSIFDSEGEYLGELSEHETGAFNEPLGVAVDPSGNVYVGDFSSADLIHKYEPAANPPVNGDNSASFATLAGSSSIGTLAAGAGATAGFIFVNRFNGELFKLDDTTGEIKYQLTTSASTVYVDPETGHVFVPRLTGSNSEVVEFDASGGAEASKVSAFKPGSTVEGVAVANSGEQVYVSRSSTESVEVFGPATIVPDVVTEAPTSNTGTRATLAGTVNPDGVELDECFFEWGKGAGSGSYTDTAPCAQSPAAIGAGTTPVAVSAGISGLPPQGTSYRYRLVAVNPSGTVNGSNQNFKTPNTVAAEAASGITPSEATLNGTVNADTATLSACQFEWGPPKTPGETVQKYNTAPCLPGPGGIGTGESPVAVQAPISGLDIGATYLYRLRVTYPTGDVVHPLGTQFDPPLSLQAAGPAIAGSWSEDVIRTEATLKALVNPAGEATTYRFEYGETAAYGAETAELSVGSDSSDHELTRFLEGLDPGTTYHYRVIATNGAAENVGPDRTFTTYEPFVAETDCPNQANRFGASGRLPECRAYEMVSPVDKSGADILATVTGLGYTTASDQASIDGDKMAFTSLKPFGDALSSLYTNSFIASRRPGGWNTHSINPFHEEHQTLFLDIGEAPGRYSAFSEDLSTGFLYDDAKPPLAAGALTDYDNFYIRDNLTDTYTALTTEAFSGQRNLGGMGLQGYSGDGNHTLFVARAQLTADAKPGSIQQLYDYHDGELELVSILPGGEAAGESSAGQGGRPQGGGATNNEWGETHNAISEDGSRIFFMAAFDFTGNLGRLYARIDGETTIPVSESVSADFAVYWTAAADGSRVIFSIEGATTGVGDLYGFDVDTETPTLIAGEVRVDSGVLGASEDASSVYFISREALAAGAVAGEPNLYLDKEGTKTLVATLAAGDEVGAAPTATNGLNNGRQIHKDFSRVTPDGRHVFFQSTAPLTGYDNTSANAGKPAVEIYRYDAVVGELDCVSCNPGEGRPRTNVLTKPHETLFEGQPLGNVEAAAWLPTPRRATHIPRMLADDGSYLFFNAHDALVPEDVNGAQDVYQWVEQGVDGCSEADGCVRLISTGTNSEKATFIDASGDGRDVFFRTGADIDPDDEGQIDIYDARVGGGFPRSTEPPECAGDACQDVPPTPQYPNSASAAFRGAGDPVAGRNCRPQAKRAVKLSRRAKQLRRKAKRAKAQKRSKALRKRSARYAKRAKRVSKGATRCRRANRRAGR